MAKDNLPTDEWLEAAMNVVGQNVYALVDLAISQARVDVLDFLVKNGLNINIKIDARGSMPIHLAALAGNVETVKWLLDNGAKIDARSGKNETPLQMAASKGNVDVIRYLRKQGANVNVKDNNGFTPLHWAILNAGSVENYVENIKCLADLGADVNARDNKGLTPLYWAAASDGTCQIENIKCLVDLGADINAKDSNGRTPIFAATTSGQIARYGMFKKTRRKIRRKGQRQQYGSVSGKLSQ